MASLAAVRPAVAQARPPVPGQPYQYWDVLEADAGARKVYFRNDLTTPITITEVAIQRCENTRQLCGTYPSKLVVDPGKTVMAFRVERLDSKLGWNYSYSFRTSGAERVSGPPPGSLPPGVMPPGAIMVKTVTIDSLVPVVPALIENASCGSITVPDLPQGHKALVMLFGPANQPTARVVMVRLDASGAPYDYRDTRHEPVDNVAYPHQSVITIDFLRQTVILQNSGRGEPMAVFRASGAGVTTAESLGNPSETVKRISKACGGYPPATVR